MKERGNGLNNFFKKCIVSKSFIHVCHELNRKKLSEEFYNVSAVIFKVETS